MLETTKKTIIFVTFILIFQNLKKAFQRNILHRISTKQQNLQNYFN